MNPPRLTIANSTVVVIDIQEKLLAKMPSGPRLVRSTALLLDVATHLGVEARMTEQYPKGLGPTTPEIAKRLPPHPPTKTAFSCCGAAGFLAEVRTRPNTILVGMETHVCVSQTAFDLLEAGLTVFLALDAIASRHEVDHDTAIRRLERSGCWPTTVEAIAFEWLADAAHPQFKTISKLIVERS
jgi:nicotinamidase-related amidase